MPISSYLLILNQIFIYPQKASEPFGVNELSASMTHKVSDLHPRQSLYQVQSELRSQVRSHSSSCD